MRKRIFLIVFAFLMTGCTIFNGVPKDAVAEIDGRVIVQNEYDFEFNNYKNIYKNNADEEFSKLTTSQEESQDLILKKGVLEKLIMRATVEKEFKNLNLTISDDEIKSKKDTIIESLGGHDKFNNFLDKNGISEEFFDTSVKESIMTDALKEEYKKTFNPTDEELRTFFEENKDALYRYDISIILVDDKEDAYKIIRSHDDFEKLAIMYSKDSLSAVEGGKLKGINPRELPRVLEDKIKTAELNEFLDPIEAQEGYYVLRVDEAYKDFDSLKDAIRESYFEKSFKNHLEELRDKNNVKVYMELK